MELPVRGSGWTSLGKIGYCGAKLPEEVVRRYPDDRTLLALALVLNPCGDAENAKITPIRLAQLYPDDPRIYYYSATWIPRWPLG